MELVSWLVGWYISYSLGECVNSEYIRINYFTGNGSNLSPEHSMRRPTRLEALPVLDRKQNNENVNNKRKNGSTKLSDLNTMDII